MSGDTLPALALQIAELSGRMALAHTELHQMRAELAVLGATVRELAPGGKLARASKGIRANEPTKHGTVFRDILDTLRKATEPLTAAQIGAACGCTEGRALKTLRYQRAKGIVESRTTSDDQSGWSLYKELSS